MSGLGVRPVSRFRRPWAVCFMGVFCHGGGGGFEGADLLWQAWVSIGDGLEGGMAASSSCSFIVFQSARAREASVR